MGEGSLWRPGHRFFAPNPNCGAFPIGIDVARRSDFDDQFRPAGELAIATLRGNWEDWPTFRREAIDSTNELAKNENHPDNRRLRLLFEKPGAALVVGMSIPIRALRLGPKAPANRLSVVWDNR